MKRLCTGLAFAFLLALLAGCDKKTTAPVVDAPADDPGKTKTKAGTAPPPPPPPPLPGKE
jgi:hypothetical protein